MDSLCHREYSDMGLRLKIQEEAGDKSLRSRWVPAHKDLARTKKNPQPLGSWPPESKVTCIGHHQNHKTRTGHHKSLHPVTNLLGNVPRGTQCNATLR